MNYITAISISQGGHKVDHITNCSILDANTGKTMTLSPASIAKLIDVNHIAYQVASPQGPVPVLAVKVDGKPHHIRTAPDTSPSDNLLKLPYIR